ncbi:MAG: hydrolase [bacterium]|nr:hydrolase [bacterium]
MAGGDALVAVAPAVDARDDTGGATLACLVAGDGPLVLCAHGFPDCARTFRHQVPALVAAGFRVVAPYLRGYAPSTVARDGRYDASALGNDLVALARHFSPGAPARLVGHDWGAIAAYAAVALAPRAFCHLATIAVPHLRVAGARFATPAQLRRSWYMGLFQLPRIAEHRLGANDFALVDRLWHDWSPGLRQAAGERAAVKASLRGREREVLAYYRAIVSRATSASARLLRRRTHVPSLYVHGVDDGCIGVALADGVERAFAGPVEVQRLDGGPLVPQEAIEPFNGILVEFLRTPVST